MAIEQTQNPLLTEEMKALIGPEGEIVDKIRVKPGSLPVKEFSARNSVLTDLYEIKHLRTVYHLFMAILISLFVNTAVHDYFLKNEIHLGFNLVIKGFSKIHITLFVWLCMFLSSLFIYVGFKYWATVRTHLSPKSTSLKLWDKICVTAFITYCPGLFYYSAKAVYYYHLSIVESFVVTMEATRFLMKSYAFVRSNAPRALTFKPHTEQQVLYPSYSKFLYFSFAPTLIYQDSYPRSKQVRWGYVAFCFLELLGAIFFISFIFERFYIPVFKDYGLRPYRWQDIVVTISGSAGPGILMLLAVFYTILHAWLNSFAEMMRFSDRMFYKDWWTSTDYQRYYRTWNVVVHDWLYAYVYKEFYERILPKNKLAAKYTVFLLSAVVHEYVMGVSLGFSLPILFVQFFCVGVGMTFLKFSNQLIGNVFLWYTLAIGMAINSCLYTLEYYARLHCPIEDATVLSHFTLRFLSCNK